MLLLALSQPAGWCMFLSMYSRHMCSDGRLSDQQKLVRRLILAGKQKLSSASQEIRHRDQPAYLVN